MASYHFNVKSKGKGYATQHYAYISRLMQYENVRKKSAEVLEHVVPGRCMPSWVKDPIEFWSSADTHERGNAKVYMEYEFALPNEFNVEQRKNLVETFLEEHIVSHNYPHSYAIHNVKSRISEEEQPHCHMMFSLKADDGIERTAEQYFKRYNAKDPSKGGAKKIQLQDGHASYSDFLLFIRKAWESHLNAHLNQICPTVTYQINGQEITIKNQVSSSSYDKYNELHGTLYLAEPKLGTGKQNETVEYLQKINEIRLHNEKERILEQKQIALDQKNEHFHSYQNEPYSTLEVIHYLKYIAKNTQDLENVKPLLYEIIAHQNSILEYEDWDAASMNFDFKLSLLDNTRKIDFTVPLPPQISEPKPVKEIIEKSEPKKVIEPEEPKSRNDGYDFW